MIVCPNCSHQNPDGATQCEACYTPLPMTTSCPNCGAPVQADATFCGQCGFSIEPGTLSTEIPPEFPPTTPPLTPDPNSLATATEASHGSTTTEPKQSLGKTILQHQGARLLHVQTNTTIELPPELLVIHVGKPNEQIPPDIDVSGFPNSEIVSRVHADIRVEGDTYYIEDVGSVNGTYINHNPLLKGNRHKLRQGDRISLGKGDLVTFLFQLS